jgi:putative membrane protein
VNRSIWTSWSLQPPVLVGLITAAWAYIRGVQRLWTGGRRRGIRWWQVACFAGGLVVLIVALVSPIHPLSTELLWVHMVQHVLLVLVAAPLLVLGAPLVPMSLAVPVSWRRVMRSWARTAPFRWVGHLIQRPLFAWVASVAALWSWHAPPLYDLAVGNQAIHAVEHLSFLATAVLFWWVALRPSQVGAFAAGARILFVFTAGVQSGALGAVLTFAGSPLYPSYAHTAAAWGLTPLQDQQLAGLIMWIPAGLVYVVAAGALFVRWLVAIEREARREEGRAGTLGLLGERP